eukprot:Nk52_evm34s805 gene=Nk52_evmTU34s805
MAGYFEASTSWKYRQRFVHEAVPVPWLIFISLAWLLVCVFAVGILVMNADPLDTQTIQFVATNSSNGVKRTRGEGSAVSGDYSGSVGSDSSDYDGSGMLALFLRNISVVNRKVWVFSTIRLDTKAIEKALRMQNEKLTLLYPNKALDYDQSVQLSYESDTFVRSGPLGGPMFTLFQNSYQGLEHVVDCTPSLTYEVLMGGAEGAEEVIPPSLLCTTRLVLRMPQIQQERYEISAYVRDAYLMLHTPSHYKKTSILSEDGKVQHARVPLRDVSFTMVTFSTHAMSLEVYLRFALSMVSYAVALWVGVLVYRNVGPDQLHWNNINSNDDGQNHQRQIFMLLVALLVYNNPLFPLCVANSGMQSYFRVLDFVFQTLFLSYFLLFWVHLCESLFENKNSAKSENAVVLQKKVRYVVLAIFTLTKSFVQILLAGSSSRMKWVIFPFYGMSALAIAVLFFYYLMRLAAFGYDCGHGKIGMLVLVSSLLGILLVWQVVYWTTVDPSYIPVPSTAAKFGPIDIPDFSNELLKYFKELFDGTSNLATYVAFNAYVITLLAMYTPWQLDCRWKEDIEAFPLEDMDL